MSEETAPEVVELIRAGLLREFCGILDATALDDNTFVISTPFVFGDGDALPMILERRGEGWRLTDRGGAASHLFFDDLDLTESRVASARRIAESSGFLISDNLALSADFDELPDAYELADLVQAVARIGALADIDRRAPYQQYVNNIRERVEVWLPETIRQPQWSPPEDRDRVYPADFRIESVGRPIVMFIAGDSEKLERSALSVARYKSWNLDVRAFTAYNPERVASQAVTRMRDFMGPEGRIVSVPPDDDDTLREALVGVGVSV